MQSYPRPAILTKRRRGREKWKSHACIIERSIRSSGKRAISLGTMACLPHRYAFRCTFSPRKGLIFHNPVIKGRRWERTSRRDVSGNKVARNYYRSACFGGSEDRAKGWTRVRSRVIKFTATPPVQCYRLTPTCATYDATTLPFHDSRQQRRTRPPSTPCNGLRINRRGTRA